ncbi:MAG: DUF429 domain-containing protein [Betaproteobacteria bacterium]|nr:MAG: DUF429 domain-containing protein [Betaproteobacteria bacterium]
MATHTIYGIDFTSSPTKSKSITVAHGRLRGRNLELPEIERLKTFGEFDAFLQRPGPWVGGFDFPFGLPRELVETLNWPCDWRALIAHVRLIGKEEFKSALNRVRESRPMGARYIERMGDRLAGSSSPMKLVNPPVGLMFYEGAARLCWSGVSVIPSAPSGDQRVALEAYPGYLARMLTRKSYKKDGKEGAIPARVAARHDILSSLPLYCKSHHGIELALPPELIAHCVTDGSGDALDAVLCAIQAAVSVHAFEAGDVRYGIPAYADPIEGWIASVPYGERKSSETLT